MPRNEALEWFFIYGLLISTAIMYRSIISMWGYSGEGIPPMFGDFEAQRHWMEITIHLPIGDWYRNTTDNNLLYWGLDYPPLTAYTSKGFGHVFAFFHPPLVAWETSRGHESVDGKFFMRLSVLIFDCLVYIPAILWICKKFFFFPSLPEYLRPVSILKALSLLMLPGLLLIDHGHFQYNGVCIGLALFGSQCLLEGYDVLGSIFFCLSLNYKQMSLYYSFVFFFVLLRKSLIVEKTVAAKLQKLFVIGSTVIVTFAILWLPFCIYHAEEETCLSSLLHVLSRQFPFNRGIFEDKVANLWYAFSRVIDFRRFMSTEILVKGSFLLTLSLVLPIGYYLFIKKLTPKRMYLSLFCSSLGFFLASFQVHEKSILLALVPNAILLDYDFGFVVWFQLLGNFTMFHLFKKDQLNYAYSLLQLIWIFTMEIIRILPDFLYENAVEAIKTGAWKDTNQDTDPNSDEKQEPPPIPPSPSSVLPYHPSKSNYAFVRLLSQFRIYFYFISAFGMLILHFADLFIAPPSRYPDLFPALFALYGAVNFTIAYPYGVYCLWTDEEEKKDDASRQASDEDKQQTKIKEKIN